MACAVISHIDRMCKCIHTEQQKKRERRSIPDRKERWEEQVQILLASFVRTKSAHRMIEHEVRAFQTGSKRTLREKGSKWSWMLCLHEIGSSNQRATLSVKRSWPDRKEHWEQPVQLRLPRTLRLAASHRIDKNVDSSRFRSDRKERWEKQVQFEPGWRKYFSNVFKSNLLSSFFFGMIIRFRQIH